MEKYDPEMAARVWQRVQGEIPPTAAAPTVQALAAAELEQAGIFLQLSRQLQGRERALLQGLYEEEKNHSNTLKGMCVLTGGKCPQLRIPPAKQTIPEIALRKCYGAALRAAQEYEKRAADPEYGPVFAALARQEQAHCGHILEILGGSWFFKVEA